MKAKLLFTAFLLILTYIFSGSMYHSGNTSIFINNFSNEIPDNQFIIGAMDTGWDTNKVNGTVNAHNIEMKANSWHKYTGPPFGWLNIVNSQGHYVDNIDNDQEEYAPLVKNKINKNHNDGMRSFMDRPWIQYLALSQRSDYQVEAVHEDPDYWFYTYEVSINNSPGVNDITDNSQHGNGVKVKHCVPIPTESQAGYIVSGLKANREQANRFWNVWQSDSLYPWYVKPRVRIPTGVSDNTPVCKIEVLDWDGNLIKSTEILAENFKKEGVTYNGQYLEEYYWDPQNPNDVPTPIDIPPGAINPGEDRKYFWDWWNTDVDTDFRIYWYGLCEMWVDYVRVENEPSHFMHKGLFDPTIQGEVDIALQNYDANNPIPNNFYIEEFEFNCTPAIAYLNDLIHATSQNRLTLMTNLNYDLYRVHIPYAFENPVSAERIRKYLIDKADIRVLVNMSYALEGWGEVNIHQREFPSDPYAGGNWVYAKHPHTLSTATYNPQAGILSDPASPTEYDDWLQELFDRSVPGTHSFIFNMKLSDDITKMQGLSHLRLLHLHQTHLWYQPTHMLKEPTSQEIELMGNLAISYGSKGIMYFTYSSEGDMGDNFYYRGLIEPGETYNWDTRDENAYGQNKWQGVVDYNTKLTNWGPNLISFDNVNRKSAIYRDAVERSDFLNTTYFADVITYKPGSENPSCVEDDPGESSPSGFVFECADKRYLQTTIFENDSANAQYFMIANRRCSPHINNSNEDNNGGKRIVKVRFDNNSPAFANFNNWKIIDLNTNNSLAVFNKSNSGLIDLGPFEPGEGKLYKIAPVMQEGGTLVTDEVVSAEQTFTCKAPVFNDGNDVTIEYGVTVKFLQNSYIEMEEGNFYSGDLQSGTEVILTAETGNTWNGLTLINNPRVEILNTVFEHVGVDVPTYTAVNLSNPHVLKIIECVFVNTNSIYQSNNLSVTVDYNFSTQPREITAIINSNTFNTFGSEMVGIYCSGSSSVDLHMQWNNFTNPSSTTGINGLTLSGVSGGVVKNNTFTNFSTSVKTLNSSVDYFNNQITSSFNGFGLELTSTSNANMSGPSDLVFGGNNFFFNDHNEAVNLKVENSTFEIAEGYNYFDISETAPITSYHLFGYFPSPGFGEPAQVEAMYNCFKFSGEPTEDPRANVTWGAFGGQIDFIFEDFDCSGAEEYNVGLIVDLGEGQFDTIYSKSGGS